MQKPQANMGIGELMDFAGRRQEIQERFRDPVQRREAFGEGLQTVGQQMQAPITEMNSSYKPITGNLPETQTMENRMPEAPMPVRPPIPNLLNSQMGPNWRGQVPSNQFTPTTSFNGMPWEDRSPEEWNNRELRMRTEFYPGWNPMMWMGP
jgi:hypothetical protein